MEEPRLYTMFRDLSDEVFLVVPSDQLHLFKAAMIKQETPVIRLIEDDDVEFLEAVGPILI
jgi:hypothetical protein